MTEPVIDHPIPGVLGRTIWTGEPLSWMEYDRRRLAALRARWRRHDAEREAQREATRHLRKARTALVAADCPTDAVDEAIVLNVVDPRSRLTADMYWLGTAHQIYTTEELADLLELDSFEQVNQRISDMHRFYRRARGSDLPCPCGHEFGAPDIGLR